MGGSGGRAGWWAGGWACVSMHAPHQPATPRWPAATGARPFLLLLPHARCLVQPPVPLPPANCHRPHPQPFELDSPENPSFMAWNYYPPLSQEQIEVLRSDAGKVPPRLHAHADM